MISSVARALDSHSRGRRFESYITHHIFMKDLPPKLTLADYQSYLKKVNAKRGFKETIHEVFALLVEEVGEFAKAIRKGSSIKVDKSSKEHSIDEEAADVFYLLINLCNHLGIDLEKAFREKEKKNQRRKWS